jgi:Fe-S-cluster containining protein
VLLETDEERRRFAAWSITVPVRDAAARELRHERVIPYRERGDEGACCPFLGRDDRCTIYEDRPQACRRFECTRHFNQAGVGRHGLFLRGNARVIQLLQAV